MPTDLRRVTAAIGAHVWAMEPGKADLFRAFVEAKANGHGLSKAEARAVFGAQRPRTPVQAGGVAVLPLYGTITPRANSLSAYSGGTSCEGFASAFDAAVSSGDVSAIVIDSNSHGGDAQGASELAAKIRAARGTKPVYAVVNPHCHSAAFWIAAQADKGGLYAPPSALLGSVGVMMLYVDTSAMDEQCGVKVMVIRNDDSPFKGEGAEGPLSDDTIAFYRQQCNDFGEMFYGDLSAGRGIALAKVKADFGQGRSLIGKRAVAAGMADKVGTLEDVLAELGVVRRSGARAEQPGTRRLAAAAGPALAAMDWLAAPKPFRAARGSVMIEVPAAIGAALTLAGAASRPAADEMDDDEDDVMVCPDCGVPLDDGVCPECGYEAKSEEKPSAGGAAPPVSSNPPAQPAPKAEGEPMPENMGAAPDAGAQVQAAALATAQEVLALALEHKMPLPEAQTLAFKPGVTLDSASREILTWKGQQQAGTTVTTPGAPMSIIVGDDRAGNKKWLSLGEQLGAVVAAGVPGGRLDPRLAVSAAASGMGEASGGDGGFLIEPQFASGIVNRAYELGQIISRVQRIPISANANGLKIKGVDETSRATGSRLGGVQSYWVNEADTATASKPKFRIMDLSLKKVMSVYYATEELLADTTALDAVAQQAFADEIQFMVEAAVFAGNGSGQPIGFAGAQNPSLVVQAKEGSQGSGTLVTNNILNMWSRAWARSRPNMVWFINQDVEPQLYSLTLGSGTAVQLLYTPPGTNGNQFGKLMGRDVIPVEYCSTLGTQGDIVLADPSQYLLIDKGGAQSSVSLHVRFLYDERTFKITYRVDGQPTWHAALTPFKGSNTQSPFITLQSR